MWYQILEVGIWDRLCVIENEGGVQIEVRLGRQMKGNVFVWVFFLFLGIGLFWGIYLQYSCIGCELYKVVFVKRVFFFKLYKGIYRLRGFWWAGEFVRFLFRFFVFVFRWWSIFVVGIFLVFCFFLVAFFLVSRLSVSLEGGVEGGRNMSSGRMKLEDFY